MDEKRSSDIQFVQMDTTKLALFKGKEIRKTIYNNEWWFVVEDVVLALIEG